MILLERKMIFLERKKKRLTLAVLPKDVLTPDNKVVGYVFIKAQEVKRPIIEHSTGYFLFMDFPEGKYNLIAGGEYYQQKSFEVDTSTIQPALPFMDVLLEPKANYPFPAGVTVLKGKVVDIDDRPLFEALITIEDMNESTISEDTGGFFIQFNAIEEDKNIILNINKEGYQFKQIPVLLRKETTNRIGIIKLDQM